MPSHNFEDFCSAVCEHLGVDLPPLAMYEGAPPAFGISCQDVDIGFMQAAIDDPSHGVLTVDFGEAPREKQADVYRVLLETNFLMAGGRTPAFGINPGTGHVVYQLGFAVSEADPAALCGSLDEVLASVHLWRKGWFLVPEATDGVDSLESPEKMGGLV